MENDDATAAETPMDRLKAQLRQISSAERSILAALPESLLREESVRLATTSGSPNDLLWFQMAALGWMELDQPLVEAAASKVYIVRRGAHEPIEALLTDLKRDDLTALFNELQRDVPAMIVPRVIESGGAPGDVVMMLAGIVDGTLRRWIKPELHDEFLKALFDRVDDLRRKSG
jgi:hypothetical protein